MLSGADTAREKAWQGPDMAGPQEGAAHHGSSKVGETTGCCDFSGRQQRLGGGTGGAPASAPRERMRSRKEARRAADIAAAAGDTCLVVSMVMVVRNV